MVIDRVVKLLRSEKLSIYFSLLREGGRWLGAARTWMQSKARNGDSVTWGGDEYLQLDNLTVRDIENFAALVAEATLREVQSNLVTDDELRALKAYRNRNNWRSVHEEDIKNAALCVFYPQENVHFALAPFLNGHGWQLGEFDSENWRDQLTELED